MTKSKKKYPNTTFDRKLLDHYTNEDFEWALCNAINVKVLPKLMDVVDLYWKHCSISHKIQAFMKSDLRNQVKIVVKKSIDRAVKEIMDNLRSIDIFSLSLSKARMEMPRIDASKQVLQFHEVIEEMKMINPTCGAKSFKKCRMCCDTKNNTRHHNFGSHEGRKMCHPSREIKQAHTTKIKASTIKTKPQVHTVVEDSESEEIIDLLGSSTQSHIQSGNLSFPVETKMDLEEPQDSFIEDDLSPIHLIGSFHDSTQTREQEFPRLTFDSGLEWSGG